MDKYDDIRPYCDDEIPAAMTRISENELFPRIAAFVYPDRSVCDVGRLLRSYRTIREFQTQTMREVNKRIIANSISGFSCSGLEALSKEQSYLYVSNHRDIMLDACLLQYYFVENGFDTSEITFGANLMVSPFVIDIGKSNKMFKIDRPTTDRRKFYQSSLHTSEYIRYVITRKHQSAWIAQRNGRTKDGNDATDQGVIKMFRMSRRDDRVESLDELHIVPVAVSYEWESCDMLKAIEVYKSQFADYVKQPGEDMHSVLTGIMQQKGRVHFEVCKPVTREDLSELSSLSDNEYNKAVASLIDKRIISSYRLYPNNYIAYDLLRSSHRFADKYDDRQKSIFVRRLAECERYSQFDVGRLKEILLGIYANPVKNKLLFSD